MKDTYKAKLNLMMDNYEVMRKPFKWENDLSRHLIALSCGVNNKKIDIDRISGLKTYLKNSKGFFSNFAGYMLFTLSGLLYATSDAPEQKFEWMNKEKDGFKKAGFKNADYLPIALYTMSNVCNDGPIGDKLEKSCRNIP